MVPLVKQESFRSIHGNYVVDKEAKKVLEEGVPEWEVPEFRRHLHLVHVPPK